MIKSIYLLLLICSPVLASSQVYVGLQIDQRSNFVFTEDKSVRLVGSSIIQPVSVTVQLPWKSQWSKIIEVGHDVVGFYTGRYALKFNDEMHLMSQRTFLKYVRTSLGLRFNPNHKIWFVSFGLSPSFLYGVRSNVKGSHVDDPDQKIIVKESKSDYSNIKGSAFVDVGFTKKFNTQWGYDAFGADGLQLCSRPA